MAKMSLTCKNIASFIHDEFKANSVYGKLSFNALNNKKLSEWARSSSKAKLNEMSGEEGDHNRYLFDMAQSMKCNEKKWFIKSTEKYKVK